MNPIPFIPETAPFTSEQRAWLNGFLAGLYAAPQLTQPAPVAAPKTPLLIMFGSQTGTAEQLAKKIARDAEKQGFGPTVLALDDFAKADLSKPQPVVIVTSTWGDGDLPDNAAAFWNFLSSETAPRFEHLHYAVLALGDSSYSDFCGAGKKIDARFEHLGAKRFQPRTDCDKEYESAAHAWIESLWPALKNLGTSTASTPPALNVSSSVVVAEPALPKSPGKPTHSKSNPFPARLVTNRKLNEGDKETRHFEISIEGSGLSYEAGDALGILPANCPELVAQIIQKLGCDGEEEVTTGEGTKTSFRAGLQRSFEIHKIPAQLVKMAAQQNPALRDLTLPENKAKLDEYLFGRDVLDLLVDFGVKCSTADFIANLRKLPSRLYSIASSPKAHAQEIHLTVAIVRRDFAGRLRRGVCSTFLAERVSEKVTVPVFIQNSPHFRPPTNPETPIIMVGPGTGIAPFRGFLQDRVAAAARGRNWLIFGHQHATTDFFYRDELTALQKNGFLSRFDTAFSRDQKDKIYVQHRLLEQGKEVWSWLNEGAHFYVCGDASRMAKDVDAALHQIAEQVGGLTKDKAAEFMQELRKEKRYQRDVY